MSDDVFQSWAIPVDRQLLSISLLPVSNEGRAALHLLLLNEESDCGPASAAGAH